MPSHLTAATIQATTLGAASNVLAQLISAYRGGRPVSLDVVQLARFVVFSLVTAPMNVKFQQLLEHAFPAHVRPHTSFKVRRQRHDLESQEKRGERAEAPGGLSSGTVLPGSRARRPRPPRLDWGNTMAKWFLDCITLGTFLNTAAFLIIMGVLKGQSTGQISANLRQELAPIIFAGYRVWPVASFISFTCVPLERRIAWLSLVGLLWGVYMSLVAERV